MKKFIYVLIVLAAGFLAFTNLSRSEFELKVSNSSTETELYFIRIMKKAKTIGPNKDGHFLPIYNLDYNNYLLFSKANIESGWMGDLNIQGIKQDSRVEKTYNYSFLVIFSKVFLLSKTPTEYNTEEK